MKHIGLAAGIVVGNVDCNAHGLARPYQHGVFAAEVAPYSLCGNVPRRQPGAGWELNLAFGSASYVNRLDREQHGRQLGGNMFTVYDRQFQHVAAVFVAT